MVVLPPVSLSRAAAILASVSVFIDDVASSRIRNCTWFPVVWLFLKEQITKCVLSILRPDVSGRAWRVWNTRQSGSDDTFFGYRDIFSPGIDCYARISIIHKVGRD